MKQPGSILLVSCYELGHQPLGVAWPLAFLQRAGFNPCALDLSVQKLDLEMVRQARLVGISVPMHTALRLGVHVARRIRETNSKCHICFFGLYAQLNVEYLLSIVADSVIGGEIEEALVNLVKSMESGSPIDVPGVSLERSPQKPLLRRINFPLPERDLLPSLERYAKLQIEGEQRLAGEVQASRGCKHFCLHCPIPPVYQGKFFVVPREVVLQDIRNLVRAGARHITFGDADFLNGPGHSLAVVRSMNREFPHLTFDFTAKIEHILKFRDLFPGMSRLGCLFVISAVESLSDKVLAKLRKGHMRQDFFEALPILRKCGITLRSSWVAFTPWTSLEDYCDMLDTVKNQGLVGDVDPVQYSIRLLIPPDSSLLEHSDIREYIDELDQANFYYRWTHPDSRMDDLHRSVSQRVEEAVGRGEDPAVTFEAIRSLAFQKLGRFKGWHAQIEYGHGRHPSPRLTESWFCCAEPTQEQLAPLSV